jgi:hypothetical protein
MRSDLRWVYAPECNDRSCMLPSLSQESPNLNILIVLWSGDMYGYRNRYVWPISPPLCCCHDCRPRKIKSNSKLYLYRFSASAMWSLSETHSQLLQPQILNQYAQLIQVTMVVACDSITMYTFRRTACLTENALLRTLRRPDSISDDGFCWREMLHVDRGPMCFPIQGRIFY